MRCFSLASLLVLCLARAAEDADDPCLYTILFDGKQYQWQLTPESDLLTIATDFVRSLPALCACSYSKLG